MKSVIGLTERSLGVDSVVKDRSLEGTKGSRGPLAGLRNGP